VVKGVIFDFDDTLVDSLESFWQLFNCGVARNGQSPIGKEALAGAISQGKRLKAIVSETYPHLDETDVATCLREMRDITETVMQEFPVTLKPDAREVLTALKARGLRIGLVTARTATVAEMWTELKKLEIARFFDCVVTGREIPRKPAPDGILHCLNDLGLKARDSVFVGDTEMDIQAGQSAGIGVILLDNGLLDITSFNPPPTLAVVDSLRQMLDYLIPSPGKPETDSLPVP